MFEEIKKYKLVSGFLAASAVFVVAGFIWAFVALQRMNGPHILHFDELRGITAVGGAGVIIFAGIFGMAVVIINGFLAMALEKRSVLFGKLTAVLTLVFAILLFIAFAAIISVN
jgi:hypothetical protein